MKNVTFAGKSFALPERTADFLQAYLERVRAYIAANRLDADLLFDLEESIAERLTALIKKKKPLSETEAITIVSSLGEPQEIFQDMLGERSAADAVLHSFREQGNSFWDKTFNRQGKIFLGVFWRLSQRLEMSVGVIRFLFLFLLLLLISAGAMALVAVLLPAYFFGYFALAERKPGKGIIKGFFREIGNFAKGILVFLRSSVLTLRNAGGGILHFAFFALLGLGFVGVTLAGMVAGPLLFTDPLIGNQQVFAHVPDYARWSALLLFLSAAVLAVFTIARSVKRRAFAGGIALAALLFFLAANFGLLAAAYEIALHYLNRYSETTTVELPASAEEPITISGLGRLYGSASGGFGEMLRLEPAVEVLLTDGQPRIEIERRLRAGNPNEADALFQKMADVRTEISGNRLMLGLAEKELAREPLPLAFPDYHLRVYLRSDQRLRLSDSVQDFWLLNVWPQPGDNGEFAGGYCGDELIFYDQEQKRMTCRVGESAKQNTPAF